jgi:arylsulfatase A-like enzyme
MKRGWVAAVAVGLALGGLALAWRDRAPRARVLERPHVVLVIGCTVRQDQLTPYGGAEGTTPYLASVAADGAMFEHAIAAAPWTKASASALLTGRHAAQVGMVEPSDRPSRRRLADQVTTLAELMKQAGYQTFGATANPNLNEVFGLAQGFDRYVEGSELWRVGNQGKVQGRKLLRLALPELARLHRPDRPLYAQFMFTDAHGPSTLTRSQIEPFGGLGVNLRLATYRAMLNRFDDAVQLLETRLVDVGISRKNTVFMLVNDHGEGLRHPPRHGLGHGNYTYASTARMPWLVWGRGIPAGRRIGGMASGIDVLPTVTGLAGVPGYEGPGSDWSAAVLGRVASTTATHAVIDTWFQASRRTGVYTADLNCHEDYQQPPQIGVPPGGSDPIRRVPRECYADDALERPLDAASSAALLGQLDATHAALNADYLAFPHTADAEPPDDLKAELEALGYAEGGEGAPE